MPGKVCKFLQGSLVKVVLVLGKHYWELAGEGKA